jgi:hypothetical protein
MAAGHHEKPTVDRIVLEAEAVVQSAFRCEQRHRVALGLIGGLVTLTLLIVVVEVVLLLGR